MCNRSMVLALELRRKFIGKVAKDCSMVQDYQQRKANVPAVDYAFRYSKKSPGDFTNGALCMTYRVEDLFQTVTQRKLNY